MNWDSLRTKLVHVARHEAPNDRVPYAFEKRIMARLAHGPTAYALLKEDSGAIVRTLWWAAGACSAIALGISVWNFEPERTVADFSEDLEETILASVHDAESDVDWDQWQ
jgi:hypothetical protein